MHPLVKRIIKQITPTQFLVEMKDGTETLWLCGKTSDEIINPTDCSEKKSPHCVKCKSPIQ
jgi:hypothetical protein